MGKFMPKINNFGDFGTGLWAHIFKATTVKYGMRIRTWDILHRG